MSPNRSLLRTITGALWAAVRYRRAPSPRIAIELGGWICFAALARAESLLLIPLLVVPLVWASHDVCSEAFYREFGRPYSAVYKEIPTNIAPEAQIVLHCLFSCFDRQKSVQEGILEDLIWGFEQSGTHRVCTITGLKELLKLGYIKVQAKDNAYIDFTSEKIGEAFMRYQPKLLEMAYEKKEV